MCVLHGVQVNEKSYAEHNYSRAEGAASGIAANSIREPSLRQLEKAPEGRSPHMGHDDEPVAGDTTDEEYEPQAPHYTGASGNSAGPAPVESRYAEDL